MVEMSNKDLKNVNLISPNKTRALNPNAVEFVPFSIESKSFNTNDVGLERVDAPGGESAKHSVPNASRNSDDEVHRYWLQQLPDDITPDFRSDGLEMKIPGDISLSGLSIDDSNDKSQFEDGPGGFQLPGEIGGFSPQGTNANVHDGFPGYHALNYSGEDLSIDAMNSGSEVWDGQYSADANSREGIYYDGGLKSGFANDHVTANTGLDNAMIDPVEFLSSNFPGFASECLADVYYGTGCDLNMTIEILSQLELQLDGGLSQNQVPKAPSAPSFSSLDFPSLPMSDVESSLSSYAEDHARQSSLRDRCVDKENFSLLSHSPNLKGAQDFASAVRKYSPLDTGYWNSERNGSTDKIVGSSRSAMHRPGSYVAQGKSAFGDKTQNNYREAPVWLETGDSVGNLYAESREEAREFARIRNACFEQARQAYLIGNKALAKELSLKGKLYAMQMAASHEKAREVIYKQRNPTSVSHGGKELMIDLHGLHVSEAIYVLKQELGVLRKTAARSGGQRLQVLICVGTGHHTKGSRTPARLPVAVEKFLLDERLQYSQPQPGLFRVVVEVH